MVAEVFKLLGTKLHERAKEQEHEAEQSRHIDNMTSNPRPSLNPLLLGLKPPKLFSHRHGGSGSGGISVRHCR